MPLSNFEKCGSSDGKLLGTIKAVLPSHVQILWTNNEPRKRTFPCIQKRFLHLRTQRHKDVTRCNVTRTQRHKKCYVTRLQRQKNATSQERDVTRMQLQKNATSQERDVTRMQRHKNAKSQECNVTRTRRHKNATSKDTTKHYKHAKASRVTNVN